MSLLIEEGKKIELIPEGVNLAVCVGLIDIGEQYSEKFDKWARKIIIMWELPEVKGVDKEGKEFTRNLCKEYTAFLGERTNLEKDLNAWRGKAFTPEEKKGFDLKKILGTPCQIQIIHKVKEKGTYSEISGIMALPKGLNVEATDTPFYFDLDDKETWKNITRIPDWIKAKITSSKDFVGSELQQEYFPAITNVNEESYVPIEAGNLPF